MVKVKYRCNCDDGTWEAEVESDPRVWQPPPATCIHCGASVRIAEVIQLAPRASQLPKRYVKKTIKKATQEQGELF